MITIKTTKEILFNSETGLQDISDELKNEIRSKYDKQPILKYELTFKPGLLVENIHSLEDIDPETIEAITITLR